MLLVALLVTIKIGNNLNDYWEDTIFWSTVQQIKKWGRSLYSSIESSSKIYHWMLRGASKLQNTVLMPKTKQYSIFCSTIYYATQIWKKRKKKKRYTWEVISVVISGEGWRGPRLQSW